MVIENGGSIHPLIIPSSDTAGLGLMNPSIYNDNNRILVNIRSINYTLYHSEASQRFIQRWGPLSYLNPENDVKLKTNNFICVLNDDLEIIYHSKVNTSKLDRVPVWEFHGLEDARIVRWDGKLYISGVRRDVKENGEGRMELSEIEFHKNGVREIKRYRIPDPLDDDKVYCNKNWIPILDMPYHYVKWTNPLEIVKYDIKDKSCKTVLLKKERQPYKFDFRGGSQVINYGDYRIYLIHETCVYCNINKQKDANYLHRFIVFDKDWNMVHVSDEFSFMTAKIEFSCGMAEYNNDLLITFGFQDNAAYLLKIPREYINRAIGYDITGINRHSKDSKIDEVLKIKELMRI